MLMKTKEIRVCSGNIVEKKGGWYVVCGRWGMKNRCWRLETWDWGTKACPPPGRAVMLRGAKHPCSLPLDAERKGQLQRSFARPKAWRAQDDRRLQIRNLGSTLKGNSFLTERSGNVYENKGPTFRNLGLSGNVGENKGDTRPRQVCC
jgi:hypothetical protein